MNYELRFGGSKLIANYLHQKLKVKINDKVVEFKMIGKEIEEDLTYIYLEIYGVKNLKSIELTNQLFFETYEEQQHIVKIKTKNTHKNIILFKDKYKELIHL